MADEKSLIPMQRIEQSILVIRGQKVMVDADLAAIYGVTTKRLNEQVKRNKDRFPADFMFQLTQGEKMEVVANCDHLERLKFSPALPCAFTEHGAIMAASVLNTVKAVEMSVFVVRAFVRLRMLLSTHKIFQGHITDCFGLSEGEMRSGLGLWTPSMRGRHESARSADTIEDLAEEICRNSEGYFCPLESPVVPRRFAPGSSA